jgi:glycosyltransferase involved in cell wall biosynthesis
MRILLLGNYPYLKSQSMDRFAGVLYDQLRAAGHQVCLLKPQPVFGRILPSATGLGKWLGYLDRFLLFRPLLKQAADWTEVVHICDQANAVYIPSLNRKPHVVTCHDMLAIRSALGEITEHTTGLTGRVYQRRILSGLKQARHVACVSKTTYGDVLRLTRLDADRVSVVRNGLNYPYWPMNAKQTFYHLEKIGISDSRPFFLHVGSNDWNKNREGLLRIFFQLTRLAVGKKWYLVLAGQGLTDELRFLAQKIGISDRIREAPDVTNEQLRALYSTAEGLIFPSLAEGFGWPIIEAQACGCPLFVSNRVPMTEIGGSAAVYFDPLEEVGAAEIIWETIQKEDDIKEFGYHNAMKYSTKAMISGYVDCYRLVVSQK